MGFRIPLSDIKEPETSCRITLNITDSSLLDVDVNRLSAGLAPSVTQEIANYLADECRRVETDFIEKNRDSRYALLNSNLLGLRCMDKPYWLKIDEDGQLLWEIVSFPCAVVQHRSNYPVLENRNFRTDTEQATKSVMWRGRNLHLCCEVSLSRGAGYGHDRLISPFDSAADLVVEGLGRTPMPI